ncbi:hypothetical protein L842_3121 [Mycobacterium intracellulare MIN_052511_1280]|nr:hypothetical protein L842_3121 [Mycobacterium intracellulare MIN_052511_1280]
MSESLNRQDDDLQRPAPTHLSVIASTLVAWHSPRNIR